MTNLFDPKHKVASRIEGQIYRWNEWTPGAQFGGTYLGSHTWTSKDDKEVTAYDFADCTIDGKKCPETEVHSFNQSYLLDEIMASVKPGQRLGIEYVGQAKPKGKKQGVRLFTPYIDPSNVDADYKRFLSGTMAKKKAEDVEDAEETAPEDDEQPFLKGESTAPRAVRIEDIMAIAAGKLGVTDEAGAKIAVKAITGLDVVEDNYAKIMDKLTVQFGS